MFLISKILCLVFLTFVGTKGQSQSQQLKYVPAGKNPNVFTPQYVSTAMGITAMLRNTGTSFSKANLICMNGMWALYNTTNWGEGIDDPSKISVISVRGQSISDCTQPNQIPQLTSVMSLNFLGNANPTMDGLTIFTESSFVGGQWAITTLPGALPADMTGYRMGSFAITGTSVWLICGDTTCTTGNSVCVDMTLQTGGLFLVRNALADTTTSWPRVVRAVMSSTSTACQQYTNPPTPPAVTRTRSTEGGKRKPVVEVSH